MTSHPTPELEDDADSIARSLVEPAAFRALFVRHHAPVHRYVSSRIGPDAAADVVSDTFLEAFRTRSRFDAGRGRDALPWLLGIATRRASRQRGAEVQWHRRREAAIAGARDMTLAPHGPGSVDDVSRIDAGSRRGELLAALSKLRRDERDALCACVLGELTYEEAARALGVPVGTIRSRIARARRRLRLSLETA